ncbi:MAG: substrate-binding domain-containing protein [Eubacteriales bacterium]
MKKTIILMIFLLVLSGCTNSGSKNTNTIDGIITQNNDVISDYKTMSADITPVPENITIKISVPSSARKNIDYLIAIYQTQYPHVTIELEQNGNSDIVISCINEEYDIGIITRELTEDEEELADLSLIKLCRVGLALVVSNTNPVTNLSSEQINKIFERKISSWATVGGSQNTIQVLSVDESLMLKVISIFEMDSESVVFEEISHVYMFKPQGLLNEYPQGITGMLIGQIDEYTEVKGVIIDDVEPTYENVQSGKYKYYYDINFITLNKTNEHINDFINFCKTDTEAINFLHNAGYVIP